MEDDGFNARVSGFLTRHSNWEAAGAVQFCIVTVELMFFSIIANL